MARIAAKLSSFTKTEISNLFAQASALLRDSNFTILYAPKISTFGRILIVAPRRIGTAPQRNRLKRRIRALFYEEKLFEKGHDFAIILKKNAKNLSFQELKKKIMDAISKL